MAFRLIRPAHQIALQGRGVGVHLLLRMRKRVEVAVNALRLAERDMEIQSQRSHRVNSFAKMSSPIVTQTSPRARRYRADISSISRKHYDKRSDSSWI